jgi:hypothetical protein
LHRDAEERQEADADETLKLVWVMKSASGPPIEDMKTLAMMRKAHLKEPNIM